MSNLREATPKQFAAKLRATAALIRKTAQGEDNWRPISASFDRLYGMERWLEGEERVRGAASIAVLLEAWRNAKEEGILARQSARDAELARLRQKMRDAPRSDYLDVGYGNRYRPKY